MPFFSSSPPCVRNNKQDIFKIQHNSIDLNEIHILYQVPITLLYDELFLRIFIQAIIKERYIGPTRNQN
jgi:hypothetical protein